MFISKDRFSFLTSNLSQAKGAERFLQPKKGWVNAFLAVGLLASSWKKL